MKILFINTLYSPHIGGGAEVILKSLVEGVAERGHEVCVLTTCVDEGIHTEMVDGIKVIRIGIKNIYWTYKADKKPALLRLFWHLRDIYNAGMAEIVDKIMREFQPDVVNTHNVVGFSAAIWPVIRKHGVPIVQVLHDQYALCPNSNMFKAGRPCETQCTKCKIFRIPHKTLSNNVDCIVGVSDFVLKHHLRNGLFTQAKVKTAIINAKSFKSVSLPKPFAGRKNVRFGYIGGLVPAKGVELLLRTFSHLAGLTDISLVIAGSGSSDYVRKLEQYKTDNIHFLGYSSPEVFFSNIDILVVPSLWNGTLPTVVFESLVNGVPVIGSSRGGIPEMIEDGKNGFLFDPDRPEELAGLIRKISAQPALLDAMQLAALQSAPRFMDIKSWIDKYINLFSKMQSKND
jgi:glycosyltransferase involved in cell wall biosynthesis